MVHLKAQKSIFQAFSPLITLSVRIPLCMSLTTLMQCKGFWVTFYGTLSVCSVAARHVRPGTCHQRMCPIGFCGSIF